MPLRIKCPTGHSLIVADDRAGRTLKCPRCGESVLVPGEALSAAVAVVESPAPVAIDRPLVQIAAEPARGVVVAPPKPAPSKPPSPPRQSAPVVKPKSRVLPVTPPAAVQPPLPVVEPLPSQPAPPPPAVPKPIIQPKAAEAPVPPPLPVVSPPSPPIAPMETAESADTRLGRSLALPDLALPDLALPENPPASAPPVPPAAHDSSDDIAAFLKLQFADQPVPSVPVRPSSTVTHDADATRTLAVYQLAAALVVAALFSVAPAVWDLVEYIRIDELDAPFVARWALVLFFVGIVQLAYAVFLFQLPDWASVWVVTLFQLALASAYAAVLGIVLTSDADGLLVGPQGLQLADKLAGGRAALWCLCMVSVATILAFFAGRMSVRWRQAERMLQSVQFGSAH